jgi:uncharacterized protein (TIGR00369 family)
MATYGAVIPFIDHCGIEDLEPQGERTYLRLVLGPQHANNLGMAHGGLLCTLIDVAMGTCARRKLGIPVMTLSMQTNFVAPGRGTLVAEGRVLRAGRSIAYCEATVTGEDGEVVATGSGVFKVARPRD